MVDNENDVTVSIFWGASNENDVTVSIFYSARNGNDGTVTLCGNDAQLCQAEMISNCLLVPVIGFAEPEHASRCS
jgi:hypothetical protein